MSELKNRAMAASYRMEPAEDKRFVPRAVEAIIQDQMAKQLADMKDYSDETAASKAVSLCGEIKERVKGISNTMKLCYISLFQS